MPATFGVHRVQQANSVNGESMNECVLCYCGQDVLFKCSLIAQGYNTVTKWMLLSAEHAAGKMQSSNASVIYNRAMHARRHTGCCSRHVG